MIQTITKIGDAQGLIIDSALMELVHLCVGDEVNVEVQGGTTLTISRCQPSLDAAEAASMARELIQDNSELFRRLS